MRTHEGRGSGRRHWPRTRSGKRRLAPQLRTGSTLSPAYPSSDGADLGLLDIAEKEPGLRQDQRVGNPYGSCPGLLAKCRPVPQETGRSRNINCQPEDRSATSAFTVRHESPKEATAGSPLAQWGYVRPLRLHPQSQGLGPALPGHRLASAGDADPELERCPDQRRVGSPRAHSARGGRGRAGGARATAAALGSGAVVGEGPEDRRADDQRPGGDGAREAGLPPGIRPAPLPPARRRLLRVAADQGPRHGQGP